MSYHALPYGETTTKPPASALIMPLFGMLVIGGFMYVFRAEIFPQQRKTA